MGEHRSDGGDVCVGCRERCETAPPCSSIKGAALTLSAWLALISHAAELTTAAEAMAAALAEASASKGVVDAARLSMLEEASRSGWAEAQMFLGRSYLVRTYRTRTQLLEGQGTADSAPCGALVPIGQIGDKAPQDFSKAFLHLDRLARRGNATALSFIGFMYSQGLGVPTDQTRAHIYHSLAADAGEQLSELSLAYRYHVGLGVTKDCDKSTRLYEVAAHKGASVSVPGRCWWQRDRSPPPPRIRHLLRLHRTVARQFQRVGRRPYMPIRLEDDGESTEETAARRRDMIHYYQYTADRGDATAQVNKASVGLQLAHRDGPV